MPPKPKIDPKATQASDKFIFRGGSKYEGEYLKNGDKIYRHGKGIYTEALTNLDPDDCPGIEPEEVNARINQIFDGTWDMDQFTEGTITFADGSRYEGKVDEHGNYSEGKYFFADGSIWDGPFKNCKMNGDGVFTDKAGIRWRGVMVDNNCAAMIQLK